MRSATRKESRSSFWAMDLLVHSDSHRGSSVALAWRVVRGGGSLVVLLSLLTLFAYALDWVSPFSVRPSFFIMKANAAAGFLFLAISLLCKLERIVPRHRILGEVLAVLAVSLGAITLIETYFGSSWPIDTLLMHDFPLVVVSTLSARMVPATALLLVLIGSALLIINYETKKRARPSQYLALLAGVITLQALVAHGRGIGFNGERLVHARDALMSVSSALCGMALALGVFCARPNAGFARLIFSGAYASKILRNHLICALTLPPAIAWLLSLQAYNDLPYPGFVDSLFAVSLVAIVVVLTWKWGKALNTYEHQLRKSHHYVRTAIESAPCAAIILDGRGTIRFANKQVVALFDRELDDLLGRPFETLLPARHGARLEFQLSRHDEGTEQEVWGGKGLCGVRKDGREIPIEIRFTSLQTDEGPYFISSIIDLADGGGAVRITA